MTEILRLPPPETVRASGIVLTTALEGYENAGWKLTYVDSTTGDVYYFTGSDWTKVGG